LVSSPRAGANGYFFGKLRALHIDRPIINRLFRSAGCGLFVLFWCPVSANAQTGDVTSLHDPSIIRAGGTFYIFSTGRGVFERSSTDLFHWKRLGRVFGVNPQWTRDYSPGGSLWAPDISYVDGEYRLYYAVSSFGKTYSAIGLAINKTLDRDSPDYRWIDRGKVIETPAKNNWNAIDPCAFDDAEGKNWMVLGSWWTGLKLVQLDRKTGRLADPGQPPLAVANYRNGIEEGYIRRHGDFYYLWVSINHCCRGIGSDYSILVGRSKDVRGPYLDIDQKPMTEGGGTLVLASYDQVRGPGSCAIITVGKQDYLIHHEYDADNRGTPTLQIRPLYWADDGWPLAGEPIQGPPGHATPTTMPITCDWIIRYNFGPGETLTFHPDGSVSPSPGTWQLTGSSLTLTRSKASRTLSDHCIFSDDGTSFVGRTQDGQVICGTRTFPAINK
jgi:arabinan endo-1,5-alpha-L-arabinosidase